MKLRVLFCTEATYLSTGYAVFSKEVIKRLYQHPSLEIAELACYCSPEEPRRNLIPWKHYPNLPSLDNEEEKRIYESNPLNSFGAWKFEQICLDFKPHVVIVIRDPWMDNFVVTSPFRDCYNLLMMAPVDAIPLSPQWISEYSTADALTSYTDWGGQVLLNQTGGEINYLGSTPPAADSVFKPVTDKKKHKEKFGLENTTIIGTVMRNQKRKLFPDLFLSFRELLNRTNKNLLLYCHTPYPDRNPWDIPGLLNEYGLSNKVLFTYKCKDTENRGGCGYAFPSFFSDYVKVCPNCGSLNAMTADVNNGVNNEFLVGLYNLFDIYIQYSCMEGFGMTQAEAAACGVPVMSLDYSGNSDVVRKVGGVPLQPLALQKEIETSRMMAVPNNADTVQKLISFLNLDENSVEDLRKKTREEYSKNYSYDTTASKFLYYFSSLNPEVLEQNWKKPADIQQSEVVSEQINQLSNSEFSKWLILNVMKHPKFLGSYFHLKMLKDINYGCTTGGTGDNYANDFSAFGEAKTRGFSRQEAYDYCKMIRDNKNFWEQMRTQ